LHTNDSAGAVTRLMDMGVEAFLISSSLEGVLAQRLVRRVCDICRAPMSVTDAMRERMAAFGSVDLSGTFYHGEGCEECRDIGYRGRVGIFELLGMNAELREMIIQRRSSAEIKTLAQRNMLTLREDALRKAKEGMTSLDEVMRVTAGDAEE